MKRVKLEFLDDIRSKKCASTGISSKVLALIDSHQCGCVKDMKLIIAKKYVRKSMQKHIDLYINGFLLCDFEPEPFSFIQEESDVIEVRRATMTFAVASNSNYSAGIEISDITSDATNISVSAASVDKKRKLPSEVRDRESRKRDMKQAGHLNFHQEEIAVVCVDNTSTGNNSVSTSSASSSSTGEAGRSNTTLTSSSSSSIIAGAADLGNGVSDPLFMWNQLQLQASVTKGSTPSAVAEKASSSGRKKTRRRRKSVAALVATASAPVAAVGDCVEVQCKDNNCGASDATSTTGRLHSNSVRNDTDKPPLPPGRPPPLPVTSSRSRVCVSETSRPALSLSPTAEDMQSPFRSYLNRDWNRHDCLASDQPCIDSSSDAVGAFNSAGTTTTCASAYHSAGHVAACPSLTLFPIQLEVSTLTCMPPHSSYSVFSSNLKSLFCI